MQLNSSVAAVVTGGASGLGEATVRALAAQGVKVAIFDMNEEKGEAVAKEVGGVFCKCNVTSRGGGRRRLRQGPRRPRPGADPGQLRRHRQRHQDRQPRQADRRDQALPARRLQPDHPDQPGRHLPLHRQVGEGHAGPGADRRRARRHRQHRLGRGRGRPDGPGGLFGVQGRHRRHDPADRPRPGRRRHPGEHHPARHLQHAADAVRAGAGEGRAWRPRCPSPSAWAMRRNTPSWR